MPATEAPKLVDPAMYARVFEGHAEGRMILEDLVRRFYDVQVFVPGDLRGQRETERRAARREPIHFILAQMGQVQGEDHNAAEP